MVSIGKMAEMNTYIMEKETSKAENMTMTLTDDVTTLIQKLTSIFVPTGDPNQCSEENDFTAGYDPEKNHGDWFDSWCNL